MNPTATKVQKISDIVFKKLKQQGFSKYFNWIDYQYFKNIARKEYHTTQEIADKIVELFINYHNEFSDFADYEF
ncbi:hypothetical protein [Riemerella anatipestifer]|uniref:Uncharacterized protein n=1 Tax=Riemerella anatipestifer TaxID=34085 RepID=A0A1S7DQN5_RIEAN|nr:hypothetical protein [Riemerella anatipestifer]AQY21430.1 hypothetical protein AB406_0472 [Riemerella anatipestifer]